VHFACHGQYIQTNPSDSYLMLRDWEQTRFTVADIVALNLDYPQMAYLSVCHGASNRGEKLLDEGIHIAGACQLAGFQHVIGTLWQVSDKYSAQVSRMVYSAVCPDGKLEIGKVAGGLHEAIRHLRNTTIQEGGICFELRNEPVLWAPYIHLGG
jgi:CHAT domain-containing protein